MELFALVFWCSGDLPVHGVGFWEWYLVGELGRAWDVDRLDLVS